MAITIGYLRKAALFLIDNWSVSNYKVLAWGSDALAFEGYPLVSCGCEVSRAHDEKRT